MSEQQIMFTNNLQSVNNITELMDTQYSLMDKPTITTEISNQDIGLQQTLHQPTMIKKLDFYRNTTSPINCVPTIAPEYNTSTNIQPIGYVQLENTEKDLRQSKNELTLIIDYPNHLSCSREEFNSNYLPKLEILSKKSTNNIQDLEKPVEKQKNIFYNNQKNLPSVQHHIDGCKTHISHIDRCNYEIPIFDKYCQDQNRDTRISNIQEKKLKNEINTSENQIAEAKQASYKTEEVFRDKGEINYMDIKNIIKILNGSNLNTKMTLNDQKLPANDIQPKLPDLQLIQQTNNNKDRFSASQTNNYMSEKQQTHQSQKANMPNAHFSQCMPKLGPISAFGPTDNSVKKLQANLFYPDVCAKINKFQSTPDQLQSSKDFISQENRIPINEDTSDLNSNFIELNTNKSTQAKLPKQKKVAFKRKEKAPIIKKIKNVDPNQKPKRKYTRRTIKPKLEPSTKKPTLKNTKDDCLKRGNDTPLLFTV